MTLQDIVDQSRYQAGNFEKPYLWLDNELAFYANNSQTEICRDGKILEDSTTGSVCNMPMVVNQLDYAYNALILYLRSVKIVISELMTIDVAPSSPWAVGATLTGATSHQTCVVVSNYLTDSVKNPSANYYTIQYRTGEFTLGEVISDGTYPADQGATKPTFADNSVESRFLKKFNKFQMDITQGWRIAPADRPVNYLVDYNTGLISFFPKPDKIYMMNLSVIRLPLLPFTSTTMSAQTPEISAQWHPDLVHGILSQAFMKKGELTYDEKKAAAHMGLWQRTIAKAKIQNNLFEANESTASPVGGFI